MKYYLTKLKNMLLRFAERNPIISKPILYTVIPVLAAIPLLRCGQSGKILAKFANIIGRRIYCEAKLYNGMKIIVPRNHIVGEHIYTKGKYEPDTVKLIDILLEPGMVFFDIGAHVGQYTLIASRLVGDSGCVHSFEPDPDTFECLSRNIEINHLHNVSANKLAISGESGSKKFYIREPNRMGSNSLSKPIKDIDVTVLDVECVTLREYLYNVGLDKIDVIKMDIEGAELDVLKASQTILSSKQKPVIIVEFNRVAQSRSGHTTNEMHQLLVNTGYVIKRIGSGGLVSYDPAYLGEKYFNVVALPRQHKLVAGA